MHGTSLDLQTRIARLLQRAVAASGKSASEIARVSGMKRDSLRRSLSGDRPFTISEAVAILDAANHAGEETLLLLLLAGEDFALAQVGTGPARFLGELFRRAPVEIIEQLSDNIEELRPRWANGTAKLLARTLHQHILDLKNRGDSIADRFST
jgi:transcriptional regulator with XRE-family HTH domain